MKTASVFESIKRVSAKGNEFWYARELQAALGYAKWENFVYVVEKARESCENAGITPRDHFADVRKMVGIGSGTKRQIDDIALTRYACYLVVQNGDPRKEAIALGQTYFAVQTRKQEIAERFGQLSEDEKRLALRGEMVDHNKSLAEAAQVAGIDDPKDFAIFQNEGYKGLYGGIAMREIHIKKKLKKSQKILDHMGSEELAANLFRATQTDAKLRREEIRGKRNANKAHFDVGAKVRQTIKELGGTMPENLPTPDKSIRQLEKAQDNPDSLLADFEE